MTPSTDVSVRRLLAPLILPLTLTLEDYPLTEQIAYPPRKLSTQGAPDGTVLADA
jgi:hypothetical protein